MIDHLLRDLQVLRKADMLIGKIWLNLLARRLGLFVFAALIGVFGLGMANVAGYNGLQNSLGTVWAAGMVALIDFAIALIVLLLAVRSRPGPEIDLALEVRKTALDQLHEDARDSEADDRGDGPGNQERETERCCARPQSARRRGRKAASAGRLVDAERTALEEGAFVLMPARPPREKGCISSRSLQLRPINSRPRYSARQT
jgi:hypothetical protein